MRLVGPGKGHHKAQAAAERVVQPGLQVGGQHGQALKRLQALQQVTHFDVGVAVVAVAPLAALAKQGVGLVKEQHRPAVFSRVEQLAQVLLRLANVLADHRRQVDAIQVQPQLVGQDFGRHSLAGAAFAAEQHRDAQPAAAAAESPGVVHGAAPFHLVGNVPQYVHAIGRQRDVVPGGARNDALRQQVQPRAGVVQAGLPGARLPVAGRHQRLPGDIGNAGQVEVELRGQLRGKRPGLRPGRLQRLAPRICLFGRRRLAHIQGDIRPAQLVQHVARVQQDGAVAAIQELAQALAVLIRPLVAIQLAGIHEQRQWQQHALALPQARKILQVARACRQEGDRHAIQLQPLPAGNRARHQLLADRVRANQLHHARAAGPQRRAGLFHQRLLRERQLAGRKTGLALCQHIGRQALIHLVQPFQQVDNALVGAQRGDGQRPVGQVGQFDQLPVTQRAVGREHIPTGALEDGQRQGEGGIGAGRVLVQLGIQTGQRGFKFHCGAQQQRFLFKGSESELAAELAQRGRQDDAIALIGRFAARRGLQAGLQPLAQPGQGCAERDIIRSSI